MLRYLQRGALLTQLINRYSFLRMNINKAAWNYSCAHCAQCAMVKSMLYVYLGLRMSIQLLL